MSSSVQSDSARHLMETNDEYRELAQKHSDHSRRLDELGARRFPTAEEQLEEMPTQERETKIERPHAWLDARIRKTGQLARFSHRVARRSA